MNFTIIPMCTSDVAMPCPCGAWQGCAMPLHLRTIGSSRARTLVLPRDSATCRCISRANSCRALCSNPTAPTLRNPTSHSRHAFHPHPTRFPSLSLCTFHHSPYSLAIPLSFPHPPSPILATFLSMVCVLKRFPLTSPRKLALTCVKRGFLRTAEPH